MYDIYPMIYMYMSLRKTNLLKHSHFQVSIIVFLAEIRLEDLAERKYILTTTGARFVTQIGAKKRLLPSVDKWGSTGVIL